MRFPMDVKAFAITGPAQEFMKAGTDDAEDMTTAGDLKLTGLRTWRSA